MTEIERDEELDLQHVPTGVPGLDQVLNGGLLTRAVYIVQGGPGEGKTILANQICFNWAKRGQRSLYVTLLAETHHRLLRHLRKMDFMDSSQVGDNVYYESAFDTLRKDGLEGILRFLARNSKRQRASLIIIDGLFALEENGESERTFREFVNDVSVFADVAGCTVLLLTNSQRLSGSPEFTMVDGWIELLSAEEESRTYRYLRVRKFRGSGFVLGRHMTRIGSDGFRVFPRLEAVAGDALAPEMSDLRLATGVRRLDEMIEGGVPYSSTTLLVGPTGVGKTSLGLSFVCQSTVQEPGLIFSFHEETRRLTRRAAGMGLDLAALIDAGAVEVINYPSTEQIIDELAERLLEAVRRKGVRRLFFDGIDGLEQSAVHTTRLGRFLTALTSVLRAEGVTTFLTAELHDMIDSKPGFRYSAISSIAENIVLLRYAELESTLYRTLSIIKMRESGFEPRVFEFSVDADGVRIGEPMKRTEGILIGRPHRQPRERADDA